MTDPPVGSPHSYPDVPRGIVISALESLQFLVETGRELELHIDAPGLSSIFFHRKDWFLGEQIEQLCRQLNLDVADFYVAIDGPLASQDGLEEV